MVRQIVVVSYASGMPGFSPSEWLDDKLMSARQLGQKIVLITSMSSQLTNTSSLKVVRIPSISKQDYEIEIQELSRTAKSTKPWWAPATWLLANTIGRLIDYVLRLLGGGYSQGRYSWTILAALRTVLETLRYRECVVVATGGPSSAHFAAVMAGMLTGKRPILEFQDPFLGSEILVSPRVRKLMKLSENMLVKYSKRVVYVTKTAASNFKVRSPQLSHKVEALYPGAIAREINSKVDGEALFQSSKLSAVHLGTLYGTRNLDSLIAALDEMKRKGPLNPSGLEVINIGAAYVEQLPRYEESGYVSVIPARPRQEGLDAAATSDLLLLVQHSDSRSLETIPFKFYDYLNLNRPILALVNSPELADLVQNYGGWAANVNDVSEIRTVVSELLISFQQGKELFSKPSSQIPDKLSAVQQWNKLLRP